MPQPTMKFLKINFIPAMDDIGDSLISGIEFCESRKHQVFGFEYDAIIMNYRFILDHLPYNENKFNDKILRVEFNPNLGNLKGAKIEGTRFVVENKNGYHAQINLPIWQN
jgi:hypothetical protein